MADETTNPDSKEEGGSPEDTQMSEPADANLPSDAGQTGGPDNDAAPADTPATTDEGISAPDAVADQNDGQAEAGDTAAQTASADEAVSQDQGQTPAEQETQSNAIDQVEIDALAAQLGETADTATAAKPQAASPQGNAIDQAEIDALATQLTGDSDASPAAEASSGTTTDEPDVDMNDPVAAAMAAAIAAESGEAVDAAGPQEGTAVVGATPVAVSAEDATEFVAPELFGSGGQEVTNLDILDDVELDVKIELGRTDMYIEDVLRLGAGSVVQLDKLAGDPVDILVNGRLIAHGEVLVLNDNFCVRINSIQSPIPELENGD